MDTIFALASARGRAGVAVIRISGESAFDCARRLCGTVPEPRRAGLRVVRDADGQALDEALVLMFEAPGSFTGEDVAEFHLHGSVAIVSAVSRELAEMPGVRRAEPGEFTRRAFENGRLDLAQVEALGDLIDAETEAQRKQALSVFSGELGRKVEAWRQNLVRAGALLAVAIDFADEEIPESVTDEVGSLITSVLDDLKAEIAGSYISERIRAGFEVAIVGPPNIGKSTLLNALAGREAAITSEIAGTTRDVIEVQMDLRGLPVTLLDTAGLRESDDLIESIGIDRARARAESADIRVFLSETGTIPEGFSLLEGDEVLRGKDDNGAFGGVSGKTGHGIDEMIERIFTVLDERCAMAGVALRERHREALELASFELEEAMGRLPHGDMMLDLVSESLSRAARALDLLIGNIGVEDLLDEVFASFCLGK